MKIIDYLKIDGNKGYLKIKITPKSRVTEFYSVLSDETLKIKIKSPPEKGKANKELINFLSNQLSVEKDKIKIISGATDQLKIIRVDL